MRERTKCFTRGPDATALSFKQFLVCALFTLLIVLRASAQDSIGSALVTDTTQSKDPPALQDTALVTDTAATDPDTAESLTASAAQDTAAVADTVVDLIADSLAGDTTQATAKDGSLKASVEKAGLSATKKALSPSSDPADTVGVPDGLYFSLGAGWSLGGFELMDIWVNGQPDSLASLGLTPASGISPPDDSALISFSIKDKPAEYTMCFPVTLSLVKFREDDRFSLSLSGSWMRKKFAATIAAKNDSIARKLDFSESMNVFSAFVSLAWGRSIPKEYFAVEGVDRNFFILGLDLSPFITCATSRKVTFPDDDSRFEAMGKELTSPSRRMLHGGAAAIRATLGMVKRVDDNSATEMGISFAMQGYGLFYERGKRAGFDMVDPADSRKDRRLSWVSTRFELYMALLHLHEGHNR